MKALLALLAATAFGSSIIQTLKSMEDSEKYFGLGLTLVNPQMVERVLHIPGDLFTGGGIFGEKAARALAEAARNIAGTDLGLGLTGRVGKGKDQDHLIYVALAHSQGTESAEHRWPSAMRFIENRMTKMALSQVRQYLLKNGGIG